MSANSNSSGLTSSFSSGLSSDDLAPDRRSTYLHALFPYAKDSQIKAAIQATSTNDAAAILLYRTLNPHFDSVAQMNEEKSRSLRDEKQTCSEAFEDSSPFLQERLRWLSEKWPTPSVSGMGRFESSVHLLPIDTSEWDEEWLLSLHEGRLSTDFPLGGGADDTISFELPNEIGIEEEITYTSQAELSAPIIRWAPDVRIRIYYPNSPKSDDDSSKQPVNCCFELVDEISEVDYPSNLNGCQLKKNFSLLELSEKERDRLKTIRSLLSPYGDALMGKYRGNVAKIIHAYCPTVRDLLSQHFDKVMKLIEICAPRKQLFGEVRDIPVSIPLLGKKLVSFSPAVVKDVVLGPKMPSITCSEDGFFQVVIRFSKLLLDPIAFSYISQSDAAKQILKANYTQLEQDALNTFDKAESGILDAEVSDVKLSGHLVCTLSSSGVMEVFVNPVKVKIGKLKLHTSITKLNLLIFVLTPFIKSSIVESVENSLRSGINIA